MEYKYGMIVPSQKLQQLYHLGNIYSTIYIYIYIYLYTYIVHI